MASPFSTFPASTRIRRASATRPTNVRTCWSSPRRARPRSSCATASAKAAGAPVTEILVETRGSRWAALGLVAVGVAAAVWAGRAGVFSPTASSAAEPQGAPATAVVARQDIAATTPVTATLGYAGSYLVHGQGG